ncbi:putative membrane protein [Halobacteroides halobius DSM 5150]|uniref:Putative membrane protein n=1 Tax=Halobacteroides halobius (strain ATCC 35273 / DSM 5150 / MD-1) TaxID=748449 RepID=L0KBZ6_HALHC|nr:hypothetical protein [Halobacteroides halobius]AGB41613.1 putative membrane protein [Halobacteroides halobius DSM 5150]
MSEEKGLSTFKIAATYIGTVVGAGFASGQEVLQFFGYYGFIGFIGLLAATFAFALYGYIILKLGHKYQADSHVKVIREAGGKWLGWIIDIVITFFLFGALTAMIAGAGAIFNQQFGLSPLWGNILMAVLPLLTVLIGITGVISSISFVVPILLTGVFSVTIFTAIREWPFNLQALNFMMLDKAPIDNWALSAVNYASYNLVLAVAILAPLGKQVKDKEDLKRGAIFGGLGLGLGAMTILLAIVLNMPAVMNYEIPMVYIASRFGPIIQIIYSGILIAEIYTTAVGNLYGFVIRLTGQDGPAYKWYVVGTSLLALVASQFGFSTLVHYLYPAVGYAGLLMLAGLTIGMFRGYFQGNEGGTDMKYAIQDAEVAEEIDPELNEDEDQE